MIVSLLFLCCSSCVYDTKYKYPWNIGAENKFIFVDSGNVLMEIESDTLSSEGALFIIRNIGKEIIYFDLSYYIQIRIGGKWYFIDKSSDWTLELLELLPNEDFSFFVNWGELYGNLPPSNYRLIKEYSTVSCTAYLFCEFSVFSN